MRTHALTGLMILVAIFSAQFAVAAIRKPATMQASQPAASTPATATAAAATTIRDAIGLEFAVGESLLRRSIISTRTPYGFKIRSVAADTSAARAGLRKGDVLLEWDGKPIRTIRELQAWVSDAKPGTRVPVLYARRQMLRRPPWQEASAEIELAQVK